MKADDLRKKSAEDLGKELLELREEQFKLRMKQATGQMTRSSDMRAARRNIARIKTVLREQARAKEQAV